MKKNKRGFTLIELLGVIVILVVIVSLVLPKIIGNVKSHKETFAMIDDDIVMTAVKLYVDEHKEDYPEVDGNTYCIYAKGEEWNEIAAKYLSQNTSNDGDSINRIIRIDYDEDKGYIFSAPQTCVENEPTSQLQGDSVCYISRTYNSTDGVYTYEDKVINNASSSGLGSYVSYYNSIDNCKYQALEQAAFQYIKDHPRQFRKINTNSYCLSLRTLITAGYLKDVEIKFNSIVQSQYYGVDIRDIYSFSLMYDLTTDTYIPSFTSTCTENFACGTYIDLPANMTPVVYDESVEKWRIVDELDPNWFDYGNQIWANAAILTPSARNTKNVGDTVEVDINQNDGDLSKLDTLGMYVWIPRYAYTIKTNSSGKTIGYWGSQALEPQVSDMGGIDIKCESKNEQKKTGSARYTGDTPTNWRTMPGFTFDGKELNGIWAGKFLISYNNSTDKFTCSDVNCSESDGIRTLPNLTIHNFTSLTSHSVFPAILSTNRSGNIFGNDSNVDSHMEKNIELATILYFKQSIYGKYGNKSYNNSNKKIYYNNSYHSYQAPGSSSTYYKKWTGRSSGSSVGYSLGYGGGVMYTGKYYYDDLGIRYTINSGASYQNINCQLNGSNCGSSFTIGSGSYGASKTIEFQIPNEYVGNISFNIANTGYSVQRSTTLQGCTHNLIKDTWSYYYFSPYVQYEVYRNSALYINDYQYWNRVSGNINHILPPGNYKIVFYYDIFDDLLSNNVGHYTGQSSCPDTNAISTLSNLSLRITQNYRTSFSEENGIGASTTGNIYGVYDTRQSRLNTNTEFEGEFVAAKYSGCTLNWCTDYGKYIDFYGLSQTTACNGSACLGHNLPSEIYAQGLTKFFGDKCSSSDNCNSYLLSRNGPVFYVTVESNDTTQMNGYRNIIIVK